MPRKPKMRGQALIASQESAPFSVEPPDTDPVFTDYIPPSGQPMKADRRVPEPTGRVQALPHRDYVSPEETREIEAKFKKRIQEMARRIWREGRAERDKYKKARELVEIATPEERKNPGPELARAIRLVEQGEPLTKRQAFEEAKRTIEAKSKLEFGQFWIE